MVRNLFKFGSFKKDVLWTAIGNFFISIKSFFLLKIITSIGKFEYGLYSQIRNTVSILIVIISLGLFGTIIRFSDGENDEKRVFSVIIFSLINFFVLAFILKFTKISILFFGEYNETFINILILWLFVYLFDQMFLNYLLVKRIFKIRALIFAIFFILDISVVYYIMIFYNNIYYILYYLIISMFISFLLKLLFFNFKKIGFIDLKPMISFSIMVFIGSIFGLLINYADRYVITNYYDIKHVGVYSAIYSVANLILIVLQPIELALYPNISYYWNNNRIKDVINYIKVAVKYELLIGVIILFFVNIFKDKLIILLISSSFLDAKELVFPLSTGLFFFTIAVPFFRVVSFVRPFYISLISVVLGIFNFFGNMIMIRYYGLLGPAYMTLVINILYFFSFFILAMKILMSKKIVAKKI